jgi:hypothetical protein
MTMGTKTIAFYGYAEIPEIENIFLEGSFDGANGMALSLQDMVNFQEIFHSFLRLWNGTRLLVTISGYL